MDDLISIILAAGKGTRMKSDLPKVLFKINEKTLVEYCVETAENLGVKKIIVIVGYKKEMVKKVLGDKVDFVVQEPQLGTGHAVMQAENLLRNYQGYVFVSNGDMPFITERMFLNLYDTCKNKKASATLLTVETEEYPDWGRIVRGHDGNVEKIVEAKDATREVLNIKEKNLAVYCFKAPDLFLALKNVETKNAQKEYYLTDVIDIMNKMGMKVLSTKTDDYEHIIGINTREELEKARIIISKKYGDNKNKYQKS